MARRSSRKKATSPVTIVESDEEGFAAVISDDLYVCFCALQLSTKFSSPVFVLLARMGKKLLIMMMKKVNHIKTAAVQASTKRLRSFLRREVPQSERSAPQLHLLSQLMKMCKSTLLCFLCFSKSDLRFRSIEITPPPTPSPVKAAGGKKRAVALCESDEEDVFVPRYSSFRVIYSSFCLFKTFML